MLRLSGLARTTSRFELGETPTVPLPFAGAAARVATWVPWPSVSSTSVGCCMRRAAVIGAFLQSALSESR